MTLFLSIVAPVFNEEQGIKHFLSELKIELEAIGESYEVILVNDGSQDSSTQEIEDFKWSKVRLLSFPLNLGHQAALDAGLRAAKGEWVLTMDSDLQHPPADIRRFVDLAKSSPKVQVIYGVRPKRKDDGLFKRGSAASYYKIMRGLTDIDIKDSAADFRLLHSSAVRALNSLPAGPKVFRLLIPSLNLRSATLEFQARKREHGESKYTFKKMLGLMVSSTVSFSTKPLWFSIQLSLLFGVLALLGIVYTVAMFLTDQTVPGWASISSAVLLMFSINFFILGVLGIYLGEFIEGTKTKEIAKNLDLYS